jgi:hypothetical protein
MTLTRTTQLTTCIDIATLLLFVANYCYFLSSGSGKISHADVSRITAKKKILLSLRVAISFNFQYRRFPYTINHMFRLSTSQVSNTKSCEIMLSVHLEQVLSNRKL